MTTPFLAEQWLSEKANEGNVHAAAIRAEMDCLRLAKMDAYAEGALDQSRRVQATPTDAARHATEADDEAIQAIWAQAEAMRLAIQKAAHDIRATLNLSGMGLTQKAEDDFQTIIIDALAKCPAPTRLLDELATVRGERDELRRRITKQLWDWSAHVVDERRNDLERHAYDLCERQIQRILDETKPAALAAQPDGATGAG